MLSDPHEVPVVGRPGTRVGGGTYLLPFHLVRSQFDDDVGDVGEVRHIGIEGDGVLLLKALADKLDIKFETVKKQIANLRSRQILDREGSDKNGYWVVLIRE